MPGYNASETMAFALAVAITIYAHVGVGRAIDAFLKRRAIARRQPGVSSDDQVDR